MTSIYTRLRIPNPPQQNRRTHQNNACACSGGKTRCLELGSQLFKLLYEKQITDGIFVGVTLIEPPATGVLDEALAVVPFESVVLDRLGL